MKQKIARYSHLARQALLAEVNLTPKPGLVDRHSNGAHQDMTLHHFYASTRAIAPYFPRFIQTGIESSQQNPDAILTLIRPIGIDCEQAMLLATNNINTHKGSIFSLGLICTAIGRLLAQKELLTPQSVCHTAALFCQGIVERELKQSNQRLTAGQRLYVKYGLTGARGEAESGFQTVLHVSLPVYLSLIQQNFNHEQALHQILLHLMAENNDTNVVSRGGLAGLSWLRAYSQYLLHNGGIFRPDYLADLVHFDQLCIEKNLSPGGSADLLILTWFLARLN